MRLTFLAAACVLLAAASALADPADPPTPCIALAMSGGGNRAAFEVGVLKGLLLSVQPSQVEYDVVTGISAGAMNAVVASVFKRGDEAQWVNFAENLVGGLDDGKIFRSWPGGLVQGLLKERGLVDTTPLRELLGGVLDRGVTSTRTVIVGATSLQTGKLVTFEAGKDADFLDGALASASIPGIFPSVQVRNETLVDGGVYVTDNLAGAVTECLGRTGGNQSMITIDVVLCHGADLDPVSQSQVNSTIPILERFLQVDHYEHKLGIVMRTKQAFPDVNWRYIVTPDPKQKMPGTSLLDFDPVVLKKMIEIGAERAEKVVRESQMGMGVVF